MNKPSRKQRREATKTVEIARSFSFKLNLGNYQSADFFCSYKAQCSPAERDTVSADSFDWCVDQVSEAIKEFKRRQADKNVA